MISRTARAIDETVTELFGAAARLAASAHNVTELAAEPVTTSEGLTSKSLAVQAALQRASLAVGAIATHAGQLSAYAHVERMDREERERRIADDRAQIEAEALRDAEFFREDLATNPTGCQPPHQWAREAFDSSWRDEWDGVLLFDEDTARVIFAEAFMRAVMDQERE